jgi:ADP-heptose:LPS heptosyltransferase
MNVKFLIIRFSSIGDIVLTTPVIRCLKEQVEGSIVHYVTKRQYLPLLQANPHIDKIHCLDENLTPLIQELKQENFDYVIDLHHNLRSFLVKSRLHVIDFSFHKLNIKKWLMVNLKIDRLPRIHIVDRYMATLSLFDVRNDGKGLDYFVPENEGASIPTLPASFDHGYIAFVVGAKHFTKQLPVHKMISLCKLLNKPIILLGGKEDFETGKIIAEQLDGIVYNACGSLSINQSALMIRHARVVITHDTGLMHIAAAFKKKILSVWGNTIPEFGMYPYMPDAASAFFQVSGLSCRPCSKIGHASCPKKHFRCMNEINEQQIADLADKMF